MNWEKDVESSKIGNIALRIVAALMLFALPIEAKMETVMELLDLPVPEEKRWKLLQDESHPLGAIIREWIPGDELISNWSEMITVQYLSVNLFTDPPETAEESLETFEHTIKKKFPGVSWRIVKGGQDDILAEWALSYEEGLDQLTQHELLRMVWTPNGIHRIAYTRRGALIPPKESKEWLSRLNNAKVKPYSEANAKASAL